MQPEGASLDLEGVSFNYTSKDAGNKSILPSKDIVLKGNNADNYELKAISLSGEISKRTLIVTSQISKYYDGTNTIDLTDYSATGLLTEETVPTVTATFTGDANVGLDKDIKLALKDNNSNYVLATEGNTAKGNISKSTLEATLPEKATDATNLKNNITYVVRESGETVKANAGVNQYVTVTGSNPFSVKATDNDNCVIIVNNTAVTKSDPVTPPSGGDGDENVTISLDATTKALPRLEEFVLEATVSPSGKTVTWSSSDPTIASVTADGNKVTVKGLKVGTATITATAADGSKKKNSYKVTVVTPITKNSAKFIAHRGLSAEAPENTIKAYELAGGAGFWGAETDVRMTKDKKFILQHDLTFKRLCGVDKKPEDMTLSEIQKLTIKSGNNISKYRNVKSATTVATLEDYLTTCKKYNMVPVIEIKMEFVEYGNETTNDSRMQAVTKNNMEDLYALTNQIMGNREYMFIAYDFETMVQMRKVLDDNATTSTNVKLQHVTNNPDQGMINYYKKRKIELDANCDKISLSDIKAFKDGGVNVGLWTVDDTERVASYISQKVDYITTNTKFW